MNLTCHLFEGEWITHMIVRVENHLLINFKNLIVKVLSKRSHYTNVYKCRGSLDHFQESDKD